MPSENKQRPLVTFFVLAYNQERFIREAVEGAFSQTYSSLEIILSDDCSPDRTFEIMREMADAYFGPHKIVLSRNEKNLGMGGHVNQLMKRARGELVVLAAGDDVSLPHRVATVVDAWVNAGCGNVSIYSSYDVVDAEDRHIGSQMFERAWLRKDTADRIDRKVTVCGPTHCWAKRLFDDFGDIEYNAVNEDDIIQFRASLRDGVLVLADKLVKYRLHGMNITNIQAHLPGNGSRTVIDTEVSLIHHRRAVMCFLNYEKDLRIEAERQNRSVELQQLTSLSTRATEYWRLRAMFLEGGFKLRIGCVYRMMLQNHGVIELARMIVFLLCPRLYPWARQVATRLGLKPAHFAR